MKQANDTMKLQPVIRTSLGLLFFESTRLVESSIGSDQLPVLNQRNLQGVATLSRSQLLNGSTSPGPSRVSQVTTDKSKCIKGNSNSGGGFKSVAVSYFFKVETSEQVTTTPLQTLADYTFRLIEPSILWCVEDTIDIGNRRRLGRATESRYLSIDDARRLDIVALGSPSNRPVSSLIFGSDNGT